MISIKKTIMLWVFCLTIALTALPAPALGAAQSLIGMQDTVVFSANDTLPDLNELHALQLPAADSIQEAENPPEETQDKDLIYDDADRHRREEVRLDHHPAFQLNRVYRIENRQEEGARLIAELHTKSYTSNNKVLAELSFYDKNRPGRKKRYKYGAGFIALNAFNFSENPNN